MLAISIHTPIHRSNSWRVISLFSFAANLALVSSNTSASCAGGIMWRNASRGNMSMYSGLPGAILLPNGPLCDHW